MREYKLKSPRTCHDCARPALSVDYASLVARYSLFAVAALVFPAIQALLAPIGSDYRRERGSEFFGSRFNALAAGKREVASSVRSLAKADLPLDWDEQRRIVFGAYHRQN